MAEKLSLSLEIARVPFIDCGIVTLALQPTRGEARQNLFSTIMSTPATNHSSPISQHLHAAKGILRDVIFVAKYV